MTLVVVTEMIPSSYPASCDSFRARAVDPGCGVLREEEAISVHVQLHC
jgi:hypothetical protein